MRLKKNGFTLVEMLIVVAIIAVLAVIAIPTFSGRLEKSRNAVDMHTAKTIGNAITYYFVDHPDALADLAAECDKKNGPHYVQVSVADKNAAVSPVLRPALQEAGLIGTYNADSGARFNITCKSKTAWKGYRIVVSTWSGTMGKPGDLEIYYWGVPVTASQVHAVATSLGDIQNKPDATGFKEAMKGAG